MVSVQESLSLRRRTTELLGAQLLRNLAPILLVFLLARFVDQSTVGRFTLSLAIATPLFVFAQLGLRTVSLTLNPDARFNSYARIQAASAGIAVVLVTGIGAAIAPHMLVLLLFVGFLKMADAFADFLAGPLQRRGRSRSILIASAIYAVAASAAAAAVLALKGGLDLTILTVAVVSLLATYLFLYLPAHRASLAESSSCGRPHQPETGRVLGAGVPLGLTTAILALVSTFPQYVVTASEGADETARFAVLLYVYALADLVTATLAQAWIPSAQRQLLRGEGRATLRLASMNALKWTAVYAPLTLLGLLATSFLFPLVFGERYTLSPSEALPLGLAVIALPLAHFTAIAVAIENYYTHSLILAVFSATVAIGGCLILIPALGITGAFIALFASVVTRALVAAGILLWYLKAPSKEASS